MYIDKYDLQANCRLQRRLRDTHFIFFNRCRGCCIKIKHFFHSSMIHIACLPSNLNIGYSEVLPELSDEIIE